MTVHRQRETFGAIPTVLLYKGSIEHSTARGCILCYHGLSSTKDAWLHDLEQLAQRGFLVVGVDAVGHGERRYQDFETRFSEANPDFGKNFIEVIKATAKELPGLVSALQSYGLAGERLGILGVSMGGFVAYRAVLEESRLRAAATLVASPEWWMLDDPESPHRHPERFDGVHLLSQTAARDEIVPGVYARTFHETLRGTFEDYEKRFEYVDYPASDHHLNPDWPTAWNRAMDWFEARLELA